MVWDGCLPRDGLEMYVERVLLEGVGSALSMLQVLSDYLPGSRQRLEVEVER